MDMGLSGKVVLITGAGRNIGRATACMFAAEGANLMLSTRHSQEQLEAVADECREAGAEVLSLLCDVTEPDQVSTMVAAAERQFGRVDVLVNNATVRAGGSFLSQPRDVWESTIAVNLIGPQHTCRAILPGMVARRFGRIINFSGGSAFRGGEATKSAAKLGIVGFTRGLAQDFGKYGITVNAVSPGLIEVERDPGAERTSEGMGADPRYAIPRMGRPEEIAAMVVFLASKHAEYITGQCIQVNGGAVYQ